MSGLEVVGLIAGIVSAFSGAANLYRDWRSKKREREKQQQNENLSQVLVTSGPDVQRHYDDDFRRLGQRFARGDEISRTALMTQLITLQQTVISLLTGRDPVLTLIHPDHDTLLQSSSSAHRNSINALAEQYQRMLQSAPISQSAVSPSRGPPNCAGKIIGTKLSRDSMFACTSCGWADWHKTSGFLARFLIGHTRDLRYMPSEEFAERFHWYNAVGKYRCCVCRGNKVYNLVDMQRHCNTHTYAEIMG